MSTAESLAAELLQSIFIENVIYLHIVALTPIRLNYFCLQLGELQFLLPIHQCIDSVSYQHKSTAINNIIIAIKEYSIVLECASSKTAEAMIPNSL